MPMLTTSVMRRPSWPFQAPSRTAWAKPAIRSRTPRTSGMTSTPSTMTGRSERLRSAVWSTARFSVVLIFSPANMRSRQPSTSCRRARSSSIPMVSGVIRFLEQSSSMPSRRRENRSNRSGSSANRSRMWTVSMASAWRFRACHSGVWVGLDIGSSLFLLSQCSLTWGSLRRTRARERELSATFDVP